VITPPPGELFSKTNDNSATILFTQSTACIVLDCDAEAREEEYMASGTCTRPQTVINVPKLHTDSEPRFRALLAEGTSDVHLALS
jgi:hypothetical protein